MHAVYEGSVDEHRTVTLASGDLEATFLPGLGMLGWSLLHDHEQLLDVAGGLTAWEEHHKTLGIPLLHPWANRLSGLEYSAAGRQVRLDPRSPLVRLSAEGLPTHGLLAASPDWRLAETGAGRDCAWLRAEHPFDRPELLEAFPFPHRLELEARLSGARLEVRITLTPAGEVPVPVSFGFHPYLRLPRVRREEWEVELPVTTRLVLDERGIPTGATEAVSYAPGPLGARTFDDGYEGVEDGATFVLRGGGREIRLTFEEGYPYAQVYAPAGRDAICFEPMTAPADALVGGRGLRLAESPFAAAFSITVV